MPYRSIRDFVADVLATLRKEKGETLNTFGDRLGVDRQYMWRLENSRINITSDYIDYIFKKLNLQLDNYLINRKTNLS